MAKYLSTSSFSLIQLHQHMSTLGLDSYYYNVLSQLKLFTVLWPGSPLHAQRHFNAYSYERFYKHKMNSYRDMLWTLLEHWIQGAQMKSLNLILN